MLGRIKSFINYQSNRLQRIEKRIESIEALLRNDLKNPKVNLGRLQASINRNLISVSNLAEVEFQVFSQWGDDGIIQYLIDRLDIPYKTFIEFGVENYTESNTRFLLINNNWSGYVIDGSKENVDYIKDDIVSWACELFAEAAFITKENINQLLTKPNFNCEIGLLSIDIDGNDYWVWKEINSINPIIVIVEYNSLFGKNTNWTVPYDPAFVRSDAHPSLLYYGASLQALSTLAESKGYDFIGCNSKGNNAYFIRKDKLGSFRKISVDEGFVLTKFREATIDREKVSGLDRIKLLDGMKVVDVNNLQEIAIDHRMVEY